MTRRINEQCNMEAAARAIFGVTNKRQIFADLSKEPDQSELTKFAMSTQFCTYKLDEPANLVHFQGACMLTFAVLNLVFSFVAILGKLLVIRAPSKASSIPVNFKKLLLSLAFSDLAVGLLSQPMFGVIIVVMLKMVAGSEWKR